MNTIQIPCLSGNRNFKSTAVNNKYLTVTGYTTAIFLLFSVTAFHSALASGVDFSNASDYGKHRTNKVKIRTGKDHTKWEVRHDIAEAGSVPADFDAGVAASTIRFEHTSEHVNSRGGKGIFHASEAIDLAMNLDTAASVSAVPVPAAAWLFGSGLVGLVAISRRSERSATVKF